MAAALRAANMVLLAEAMAGALPAGKMAGALPAGKMAGALPAGTMAGDCLLERWLWYYLLK